MSGNNKLKQIVEAALLAAGKPLSLDQLIALFPESEQPEKKQLREVLDELSEDYQGRGIEVTEVGSGFRIQVRGEFSPWISKLWVERPPKYTRALLETLALIAYRQPITRGEIEDIRGVSVSTNIIKTLTEREWVRVVGHRDVPGKPALYATTKEFLDYFNLKSLNDLPTLAEIRDLESINRELELQDPDRMEEEQKAQGAEAQEEGIVDEPETADTVTEEEDQERREAEQTAQTDSEEDSAQVVEADIMAEEGHSQDEDPPPESLFEEVNRENPPQAETEMAEESTSKESPLKSETNEPQ
jgi:segregation and condensation protein B